MDMNFCTIIVVMTFTIYFIVKLSRFIQFSVYRDHLFDNKVGYIYIYIETFGSSFIELRWATLGNQSLVTYNSICVIKIAMLYDVLVLLFYNYILEITSKK